VDERFLYLPSIGFCLLAAGWIAVYLRRRNRGADPPRAQMLAACAVLFLACAPLTLLRQAYWQNDISLWSAAAETAPGSGRVRLRLGIAYLENGQLQEADRELNAALAARPHESTIAAAAASHLAITKQLEGKNRDAERLYRQAILQKPDYFTARHNYALLLEKEGRTAEAIVHARQAVLCNPKSPSAHRNLARLLEKTGNAQEAVAHRRIADGLER